MLIYLNNWIKCDWIELNDFQMKDIYFQMKNRVAL